MKKMIIKGMLVVIVMVLTLGVTYLALDDLVRKAAEDGIKRDIEYVRLYKAEDPDSVYLKDFRQTGVLKYDFSIAYDIPAEGEHTRSFYVDITNVGIFGKLSRLARGY